MFTRSFLIGALALTAAEAFAPGPAMIRPTRAPRAAYARHSALADRFAACCTTTRIESIRGAIKTREYHPRRVHVGRLRASSGGRGITTFSKP